METSETQVTTIEDLLIAIKNTESFSGDDCVSVKIFSDCSGSVFINDHAHHFDGIEEMFSILCEK